MQTKMFHKFLLMIFTLFFLNNLFAANINCPPVEKIRSVHFNKARPAGPQFWYLFSDSFENNGESWNVLFASRIPDTVLNNFDDALRKGQIHFTKLAIRNNPVMEKSGQLTSCLYNSWNPSNKNSYGVVAYNPGYNIP